MNSPNSNIRFVKGKIPFRGGGTPMTLSQEDFTLDQKSRNESSERSSS